MYFCLLLHGIMRCLGLHLLWVILQLCSLRLWWMCLGTATAALKQSCGNLLRRRITCNYVGTVFADSNSRDDSRQKGNAAKDHREENIKIAKWMINAIKRRIQNLTKDGVMVTPDWEAVTRHFLLLMQLTLCSLSLLQTRPPCQSGPLSLLTWRRS